MATKVKTKTLEFMQDYKGQSILIYRDDMASLQKGGVIHKRTFHYGNKPYDSLKEAMNAIDEIGKSDTKEA